MTGTVKLSQFVGNSRIVEILMRAVECNRLPHALIFAGPAGVGKRTLAELLAMVLNCESPKEGEACSACRSCTKILSGSHPDVRTIEPDGAFIKIDQVRALIGEIAYQPFEARVRVVILDGADKMREEAANSLLKTLEEPASRTILVLVTTNPYALLQTIRSRCRLLQFGLIPRAQIESFLRTRGGMAEGDARAAAAASEGSLGAALAFDIQRHREVRDMAMQFVRALLLREGFAEASRLAAQFGKDKDVYAEWLAAASSLLEDMFYSHVEPERVAQSEVLTEVRSLARGATVDQIVAAIEALNTLRRNRLFNVNRQIALESIYLSQG